MAFLLKTLLPASAHGIDPPHGGCYGEIEGGEAMIEGVEHS
jgi:hypothetical protein